MHPKKISLIGAGRHSETCHAPSMARYVEMHPGRVVLQYVCDIDSAKAEHVCKAFSFEKAVDSIDAIFSDKDKSPDALVVVMPIQEIVRVASRLLEYEIPLLIEKPLGASIEEATALLKQIKMHNAVNRIMVSLNRRFDPSLQLAYEWLKKQKAKPRYIRASMCRAGRDEVDYIWRTGIHVIDVLNAFWGPLTLLDRVYCPAPEKASDNLRIADFSTPSGTIVHLEILPECGEWKEYFEFFGDGYTLEVNDGSLPPWRVRAVKNLKLDMDQKAEKEEPSFVSNGSYGETEAFFDFVCGLRDLPIDVNQAYESSVIAHKLQFMKI